VNKKLWILIGVVVIALLLFEAGKYVMGGNKVSIVPSPTPAAAEQLTPDKYPRVSLEFSPDGHYVTVKISQIVASSLEYNLIYDAMVKKSPVNTGVTGSAKLDSQSTYTYKQLLGSESSGKFTYHENIKNAVMELTLRDANKYSIFSATYPFSLTPGKSIDLVSEPGN